ncbi:MAG: RDD family protein [Actinobacteria bacterium]|nr:RDD family protein [Actinomycetota bacterium]
MTHPEGVTLGRRLAAITVDWLASYAIAFAFFAGGGSYSERVIGTRFTTLLIFVFEYAVLITLTGASFGHRLLRLKVVDFDNGGLPSIRQALIRTGLMALVITAITYDEDGRGIHERFSRTKLARA